MQAPCWLYWGIVAVFILIARHKDKKSFAKDGTSPE
jgi:hypothetical protein